MTIRGLVVAAGLFFSSVSYAQDFKGWHLKDLQSDSLHGISLNKAYQYLQGHKSKPVIVAVIDSGVDTLQEDLKPVLWHNPKEIPGNGKDDDGNGYVDDVYGWNFLGSKKGDIVVKAPSEVARIYHQYRAKFEGKNIDPNTLSADEKQQYEMWKYAARKITPDPNEQMNVLSVEIIYSGLKKFDKAIREDWKKEEYTIDDLQNFQPSTPAAKQAKNGYIGYLRMLSYEPDVTNKFIFSDMEEYLESKRAAFTAKDTPPEDIRKTIGDNYADLNDKYYGNGNVMAFSPTHGTHVSGIIAAVRNNGLGMDGVADNVRIMMVRAVPNGDEYDKDIALAIRYAVDNGAKIINMSFGKELSPQKPWVDDAVKYAEAHGVLLVHAAGNDGENLEETQSYPTPYFANSTSTRASNYITVGASSDPRIKGELVADFSNYGNRTCDVFAPGEKIYSTLPGGNKYGFLQGTSMAAPVVAGLAALIWSYYPELTAAQVKEAIVQSVWKTNEKVNKPGSKDETSFRDLSTSGGIVNAFEAIKYAEMLSKKTRKK